MSDGWRIAAASTDGKVINDHFGRADVFYIVDISQDGTYMFIEKRDVGKLCVGHEHSDDAMTARIKALNDCCAVLVAMIGPTAKRALDIAGIAVFEQPGIIDTTLKRLADYFIKMKARKAPARGT
ncbi:MAG: dinitrogenase iron-molybdenum cofactor biosynthesis protein [Clostridiales bacterium]|nr:dinitrogenase iron-molybdenum cofactor biosynthesis protein [Clostridiales bacterium]